jgi:5-methyltetrahydropteroyltriglutamate--homocysteine methyltransferase
MTPHDRFPAQPLTTTVIGSWPKPDWLSSKDHDRTGWVADRVWRFEGAELSAMQDEATRWAVREQESTGVAIVTDGEIRRDDYVYHLLRHLDGFDFDQRVSKIARSGSWRWNQPSITGPITSKAPALRPEYEFVQGITDRNVKVTLPGPMTIIDSVNDAYYHDEEALAMALAQVIQQEVRALADAGCSIVQFDEPSFARYPDKLERFGARALNACVAGVDGITTAVHVCRGYPIVDYAKSRADSYERIFPLLAATAIDHVSIEASGESFDWRILDLLRGKGVILGTVDVGASEVESVAHIRARLAKALEWVDPWKLFPAPDCGLVFLAPEVAKQKLIHLTAAADDLRNSFMHE